MFQDERYKKYIGKMAIVPLSGGREVPIIADEVFHLLYTCVVIKFSRGEP